MCLAAEEDLAEQRNVLVVRVPDAVMIEAPTRRVRSKETAGGRRGAVEGSHSSCFAAAYTRPVSALVLDNAKSKVKIHTFAEGLFARLAHDIELVCTKLSGTGDGAKTAATLEVDIDGIEVAGVLENGQVNERTLSAKDKADIVEKMKKDVFHASGTVRVEATLEPSAREQRGSARVRIVPPKGRAVERTVAIEKQAEGQGVRVTGKVPISLSAIGSDALKGPMNAFRVKDEIQIVFDVVFVAP